MTSKDLTKELYFDSKRDTTINELKKLAEYMLGLTWTINIYRNKPAQQVNLADLGWTFKFGKTKRAAGRCVRKGIRRNFLGDIEAIADKHIELSMHYVDQNLEESKQWEEVIRHELAHAIDFELRGKSNHDRHWRAVANEILSTGARTFTSEQLKDEKESKYTLSCADDVCDYSRASHKRRKANARTYPICPTCYDKGKTVKLVQTQNY